MEKAIIIGGTTGIGSALTKVLVQHNYHVLVTGIEQDIISNIREAGSQNLEAHFLDCITDRASEKVEELVKQMGGLDLLVFCAGIGHLNKDLGFKVENRANQVNVLAFTEVVDWGYRYFDQQGFGHIVGITSVAGLFGFWRAPAYHAAKAYQMNYMAGLRQKAIRAKKPIFITDIRPGFVDTAMAEGKEGIWKISAEKAGQQIFQNIKRKSDIGYTARRWVAVAKIINILPNWLLKRM